MREITHLIDGQSVAGTSGRFGDVFNPNTGEVQARVALASVAEVDAAVQSALRAQSSWTLVNPQRWPITATGSPASRGSHNACRARLSRSARM